MYEKWRPLSFIENLFYFFRQTLKLAGIKTSSLKLYVFEIWMFYYILHVKLIDSGPDFVKHWSKTLGSIQMINLHKVGRT